MNGIELIAAERERQITTEGWTSDHDDQHDAGELALAAACYAAPEPIFVKRSAESGFFSGNSGDRGDRSLRRAGYYDPWPFESHDWKPTSDPIRNLVKAGALIAAEIDRLQRAASTVERQLRKGQR